MTARRAGLLAMILVGLVALSRAEESTAPASLSKAIRTATGVGMVLIPGGWFQMGSDRGRPDEQPVHRVRVDAFYMDTHEVTQEQYGQLVLGNPSHFKGPKHPVEQISWPAAAMYCNARSRAEAFEPCYDEETAACDFQASGYRLPTEAEWEYACRAGTKTEYSFASDQLADHAWYGGGSEASTRPVGGKLPNPWGLYDIHGNVAEWCNDVYEPRYYGVSPAKNPRGPAEGERYVLRGGGWSSEADKCRSAYRRAYAPGFNQPCFLGNDIGFRCVRAASD